MKNIFILSILFLSATAFGQELQSPFGDYEVIEALNKNPDVLVHSYHVKNGKIAVLNRDSGSRASCTLEPLFEGRSL